MAALLVVAIVPAMSPPRALPCEKIHPFHPKSTSSGAHFVPLFLSHSTSRLLRKLRYKLPLYARKGRRYKTDSAAAGRGTALREQCLATAF